MENLIKEINSLLEKTGYTVNTFSSDYKEGNSINYIIIPSSSDGIKEQYRLEITIISDSFLKGAIMLDDVKEVLLTQADEKKTDTILSIELNGGGNMINYLTKTYHMKAYFVIKTRMR